MTRTSVTRQTRIAIVEHAIRWSSNILTEVTSNHLGILSPATREHLASALSSLGAALRSLS